MGKYSSYVLFLLLAVFVVILYANGFGPMDSAQQALNDSLCRATAEEGVRQNIALIRIDARAEDDLGEWPWNRDLIADLVAATGAGEPKALVVNLDLGESAAQDSAGYTGILADQLSWVKNAVLPYDIALATYRSNTTSNPEILFNYSVVVDNPLGLMDAHAAPAVRKVFLPAEKLVEGKPYLGFDYVAPDGDRVLRHQPLLVHYEGYYYPSVSLIAAAAWLGVKPSQINVIEGKEIQIGSKRSVRINNRSEYFVNFPPENSFVTYSAADVLQDDFDRSKFKNKLVMIGLSSSLERETFATPMNPHLSKLELRAATAENIINGSYLTVKNDQPMMSMLILFAIGALCAFIMPQISLLYRFVLLIVSGVLLANVNYFLFSSFQIIPETVYIALELLLFMGAAPILDSSLIKGDKAKEEAAPTASRPNLHDTPADRQLPINGTQQTQGTVPNQPTEAMGFADALDTAAAPMKDHQAIDIDIDMADTVAHAAGEESQETSIVSADEPVGKSDATAFDTDLSDSPADTASGDDEPVIKIPNGVISESGSMCTSATPGSGIPTNLGRYQISGKLGKGAMGMVYKGVDPAINRPVALKTIRLDFVNDPEEMEELRERLYREAQAAGKLSHPNIVTIYDVGSEGPLQYIAMEYLKGQTLEDMIKRKTKFNYRIISQIIIQICSALQYAHENGIVHRDIKPANVMIMDDYQVKVMDYGIARVDTSSMTKTGIAMGTPAQRTEK